MSFYVIGFIIGIAAFIAAKPAECPPPKPPIADYEPGIGNGFDPNNIMKAHED